MMFASFQLGAAERAGVAPAVVLAGQMLGANAGNMISVLNVVAAAAVVGLLIQFFYLGGIFVGISRGVSAGVAALIVGLQPLLTAAVAGAMVGERVTPRQWVGLALGL